MEINKKALMKFFPDPEYFGTDTKTLQTEIRRYGSEYGLEFSCG